MPWETHSALERAEIFPFGQLLLEVTRPVGRLRLVVVFRISVLPSCLLRDFRLDKIFGTKAFELCLSFLGLHVSREFGISKFGRSTSLDLRELNSLIEFDFSLFEFRISLSFISLAFCFQDSRFGVDFRDLLLWSTLLLAHRIHPGGHVNGRGK
jgi:hypothetical protein